MPTNTQLLTDNITHSPLTADQQQAVIAVLPQLGEHTLEFLSLEISRSRFGSVKDIVLYAVTQSAQLLARARGGDVSAVTRFLADAPNDSALDFGRYIVPFVLDLKQILNVRKIQISDQLHQALYDFEIHMFPHLPPGEMADILHHDVLYFAQQLDPVMTFKKVYVTEHMSDDGTWNQQYLNALMNNEELLGTEPFVLNNRKVPPMIKHWLSDFMVSEPGVMQDSGAYQEVHYMSHSKNVALLPEPQKRIIFSLLKLYVWLISPEASIEEIEEYESQRDPSSKVEADIKTIAQRYARPTAPIHGASLSKPLVNPVRRATNIGMVPPPLPPQHKSVPAVAPTTQPRPTAAMNVQDILNRQGQKQGGVVFGEQTNVQVEEMSQRIEAERHQKQSQIDKKLEELKNRKSSQS